MTEHIDEGDGYDHVKKIISISIVYFDLGRGNDYLYHGETVFTGVHTHDELEVSDKERKILPKRPQDIYPEYYIIRVNEFDKVATTPLDQWVRYLKTGVIEDADTAPGLPSARERLRYYDMDKDDRIAYDNYLDGVRRTKDQIDTAKSEGINEGIAQGRALEKLENARALKLAGVDLAVIAQTLGLTLEEISKL